MTPIPETCGSRRYNGCRPPKCSGGRGCVSCWQIFRGSIIAYKLLRRRANGTLGPLFIDRKLVIEPGEVYWAQTVPTKGFAVRHGFHCTSKPVAPHLSPKGRVWCKVEISGITPYARPEAQGGLWYTADRMRVLEVLS